MIKSSDGDAHTIRRVEAFSDIVIGFCLAEIGTNLVVPKSGADVGTLWTNAAYFLMAFTFIAIIWWLHHRIFSKYFALNPFTLGMNFIILAGVVLTAYFFQAYVHVAASPGENAILYLRIWLYSFGNLYTLLAILLIAGIAMRRSELSAADIRWGIQRVAIIATAVVFFAVLGSSAKGEGELFLTLRNVVLPLLAVMILVVRIGLPVLLKRLVPDRA